MGDTHILYSEVAMRLRSSGMNEKLTPTDMTALSAILAVAAGKRMEAFKRFSVHMSPTGKAFAEQLLAGK